MRARYARRAPLKVLYEIWNDPLQTVNGDHLISQVISLCGGRNIFADASSLAPRVNIEVGAGTGTGRHRRQRRTRFPPAMAGRLATLPGLAGGGRNGLFFVHPDLLERPTARVLLGAQSLCEQLDTLRR